MARMSQADRAFRRNVIDPATDAVMARHPEIRGMEARLEELKAAMTEDFRANVGPLWEEMFTRQEARRAARRERDARRRAAGEAVA